MKRRLLVATRKGLFTIERAAADRWEIVQTSFLADPVTLAVQDPRDGTLLAALEHGHFGPKLHRSTDGGVSWVECACPEYPPQPDGEPDTDGAGREVPWKLVKIWGIQPGGADQPGRLWCGTIPGGLFRSDDSGDSWTLVRSLWDHPDRKQWFGGGADLPGIHHIQVDPRNSNHVRVGVSCGGVWVTEDDGQTWNCKADGMRADFMPPEREFDPVIQDAHAFVQCRDEPDSYWVQHHNGIFRSTDNCQSWQEIQPDNVSSFGFPVAVHPADGGTAWFVPAISDQHRIPTDGAVVVSRTRDGGATFEVLRNGLPQQHAYDLVYRHALDVDNEGRMLAMGSTTGSLWISEDQGDRWTTISTHLPPIYCVCFGE